MIWPVSKRPREAITDRSVWRHPWYFRCWSCARPHTECTCGSYVCLHHDECLSHVTDKPIQDTPEKFADASRALGTVPCSHCHRVGEYIESSGLCWRCERSQR